MTAHPTTFRGLFDSQALREVQTNMASGAGHSVRGDDSLLRHAIMHIGSSTLRAGWQGALMEPKYKMRKQVWGPHARYWHVKMEQRLKLPHDSRTEYYLWFTLPGDYTKEEAHRAACAVIDLTNMQRKEST